jgi:hypothetical protein
MPDDQRGLRVQKSRGIAGKVFFYETVCYRLIQMVLYNSEGRSLRIDPLRMNKGLFFIANSFNQSK